MSDQFTIHGLSEAVFIVADLARTKQFYCDVIGWQALESGECDQLFCQSWNLPTTVSAKTCLVCAPESKRGAIRLVELSGIEQDYMRSNSQIWDVGGIFDVNVRVNDSFALARELHDHQWFGANKPCEMTFGQFSVFEWLAKSHDGITHALIERITPPLENPELLSKFSPIFNASIVVSDHQSEQAFFEHVLGFTSLIEQTGTFEQASSNVFGLPNNLVDKTPHQLSLLSADGSRDGTIEIASFPELQGNDFSQQAQLPNIGIACLRFRVDGIDAFVQHLIKQDVDLVSDVSLHLPSGILQRNIVLKTPAGNCLAFYQER